MGRGPQQTLRTTCDGVVADMCAVLSFDDVDVISYDTSDLDFGDLGAWCGRECLLVNTSRGEDLRE